MADDAPAFSPDSYVVWYGRRGVLGTLAAFVVGLVVMLFVFAATRPGRADVIVALAEAALTVALCGAIAREVRHVANPPMAQRVCPSTSGGT